jgi:hypothetical protein
MQYALEALEVLQKKGLVRTVEHEGDYLIIDKAVYISSKQLEVRRPSIKNPKATIVVKGYLVEVALEGDVTEVAEFEYASDAVKEAIRIITDDRIDRVFDDIDIVLQIEEAAHVDEMIRQQE